MDDAVLLLSRDANPSLGDALSYIGDALSDNRDAHLWEGGKGAVFSREE